MDFRKCPACQASVLEDDVDDCPFCGASMSGKPKPAGSSPQSSSSAPGKSAPVASPPAGKGKVPPETAKPKPAGNAKKTSVETPSEENPFEVDTSAVRKAIKLSPRPTKTRTYEIVCPMCETVGFMPPLDAGKDVQCANAECIVPVFKSKRPKVEAPPEPKPKSKKNLIIAAVAVVLLGGSYGIYSMMNPGKSQLTNNGFDPLPQPEHPQDCDDCPPVACDHCPSTKKMTLAEIVTLSLENVVDAARDRGDHNRNVGTQLASETFAVAGKIPLAQTELKRLQAAGSTTGYLQLQPFAEIAWSQLKSSDIAGATKSATDGLSRAKNLPPTVRHSLDSVTSLAGVLVAVGKKAEAVQLIDSQIAEAEGQLGARGDASVLWRAALDSGTYDIGLEASRPYHILMPDALRIGVIETLVAHGFEKEAWSLIETAKEVSSRDACRAAWAGRLAEMKPESVITTVTETLSGQSVSAVGQIRVWSAVAAHLKTLGQDSAAQASLEKALAIAKTLPAPVPEKNLSMKQIYDSQGKSFLGLSNPSQEESSAMACADLALVCQQLNRVNQANEFLEKSMEYARATSLGPVKTQEMFEECQTQEAAVKSKLQQELGLGNSAVEQRTAFNRYRLQCERLNKMAQARLDMQVVLLRAMAKAGLRQQVWDFIVARDAITESDQREPFLGKSLPGLLVVLADLNPDDGLKKTIVDTLESKLEIDIVDRGMGQATVALQQKDWKKSAESLRNFYRLQSVKGVRDQADIETLSLYSDVMQTFQVTEAFQFLTTLTDPVLRQDGFMLLAAYTAKIGTAPEFWEHLKTPAIRDLGALDKTAIYRGFATSAQARTAKVAALPASPPTTTTATQE